MVCGDLTPRLRHRLQDPSIFPGGVLQLPERRFYPKEAVASGRKGVVWRVVDGRDRAYAAKITLAEEYSNGSRTIEDEFERRRGLQPPLFTTCVDVADFRAEGVREQLVVLVEEWVENGITLRELIEDRPAEITTDTIVSFATQMAGVLTALEPEQLEHDDLHAGNIMLRPSRPGELGAQDPAGKGFQLVVVDTGSLKPSTGTKKLMSDVDHIANHLAQMHNVVLRRRDLSLNDRRLLFLLKRLLDGMTDDDATRSIRSGRELLGGIQDVTRDAASSLGKGQTLSHPFELINAEQIRDDKLLLELFAKTSWLHHLTSRDAVLLTGPRGCGKSMVLRWLALRTHATVDKAVPLDDLGVTGVYISCASEVQTRMSMFRRDEDVAGMEGEIIHFFNLLHVLELIRTLAIVAKRPDSVSVFGLGQDQINRIFALVEKHVGSGEETVRFNPGPLASATHLIEGELFSSQRRLHQRVNAPTAPPTLIADITDGLVEILPFLARYPIAFLLDDFSTHRVSAPVQRAVGDIVWGRRSSHHFKVSSEKHGTVAAWSGLTTDPDRERVEIDCGAEFLDDKRPGTTAANREFTARLLNQRLQAARWRGRAEDLLGTSPSHTEMTEALLKSHRSNPAYYGLNVLAMLCSGDIAALLMLYRRILSGCNETSTAMVPAAEQHQAVEDVSRLLLSAVVHHRPLGDRMLTFAREFGRFVGASFKEGKGVKERGQIVPNEIPRIEVESNLNIESDLPDDDFQLIRELLRRSVFIELTPGRARHEKLSTLRWHFRRIYLPAFRAGLYKNDAIKIAPGRFQELLEEPSIVLKQELELRRRTVIESGRSPDSVAVPLFNNGDEGMQQ